MAKNHHEDRPVNFALRPFFPSFLKTMTIIIFQLFQIRLENIPLSFEIIWKNKSQPVDTVENPAPIRALKTILWDLDKALIWSSLNGKETSYINLVVRNPAVNLISDIQKAKRLLAQSYESIPMACVYLHRQ